MVGLKSTAIGATPELIVIMPVFNEQASVRKVVMEWFQEIENWTENFIFLAIDDGSTDGSLGILNRLRAQLGMRFEIISRENRGHGQSCVQGYREAVNRSIPFVLQIDSDGQCDPQYFFRFWRAREQNDVIYGKRTRRDDGWRRVLASLVLKFSLLLVGWVWLVDANVPYRLMRTKILLGKLERLPADFFLANVGLAVLLRRSQDIRHQWIPIRFRERYGGEPSVKLSKFGNKALELLAQLRRIN